MGILKLEKIVSTLPVTLEPNVQYFVRVGEGFDLYVSDSTGAIAHKINQPNLETIVLQLTAPETNISLGELLAINSFPYNMEITSIKASVAVAPTGSNLIVDMLKNDVSIMTDPFVIEATELSTLTATTPPTLSDNTLSFGDKLSFNVDQIGATVAGEYLTVTINGVRV
jgi:hypothetical protein